VRVLAIALVWRLPRSPSPVAGYWIAPRFVRDALIEQAALAWSSLFGPSWRVQSLSLEQP
jgi:hypothetical protein